jgi:hypothetical protein
MFERVTTFRRSTVSDDPQPSRSAEPAGADARDGWTRAQTRAQSRCAPLTPAEFRARRQVADQGLVPLSGVLDKAADKRRR